MKIINEIKINMIFSFKFRMLQFGNVVFVEISSSDIARG